MTDLDDLQTESALALAAQGFEAFAHPVYEADGVYMTRVEVQVRGTTWWAGWTTYHPSDFCPPDFRRVLIEREIVPGIHAEIAKLTN